MERLDYIDAGQRTRDRLSLLGIILGLALAAVLLYKLAGPPHLPADLPSWDRIVATLQGSDVPLEALAYILTTAAWVLWLWIVASLLLRLFVVAADTLTHGAAWVDTLRAASDRVTLPIVRRVVDGALVAVVVVNLVGRTALTASAAPLTATPIVAVAGMNTQAETQAMEVASQQIERRTVEYTVQPRDTLWTIAERFYGTGEEFPRLVDANAGRVMPDGSHFTRAGIIQPGWILLVPLPSEVVEVVDEQTYYVVEPGDTLWGISARFLSDPLRWPEIFELNRGVARHPYGWTFTNPSLIWPGLRLQLPISVHESAPPPDAPPVTDSTPVVPPPLAVTPAEPTPVAVSPTPVVINPTVEPTVEPTLTVVEPTAIPTPVAIAEPSEERGSAPSPIIWSAIALVTAAAAGAAALMSRRRVRRSLDEPPIRSEEDPSLGRGFVEAELARALAHRLHGGEVEAATLVADQVCRFLREQGVDEVGVVSVQQGRDTAALTLNAGLRQQARILELAEDLGAQMGGTAKASITADHDILLQLSGLKLTTLLMPAPSQPDSTWLLPVGVIPKRDTFYANWRELGNILVVGSPGSGTDVVLTSLLSAVAARAHPDEVLWWTIANRRLLPAQLAQLPHQLHGFIDPTDDEQVAQALEQLQRELGQLMQTNTLGPSSAAEPAFVLAIGELADLQDYATVLDTMATHGPAHGVRLIAATSQVETIDDETLALFSTRMILQTLDEEQSIRLLGQPDAADLAHGEMLLRLDGRTSIWARGFRVSPDHLDQLVRLMREAANSPNPGRTDAPQVVSRPQPPPAAKRRSQTNGAASQVSIPVPRAGDEKAQSVAPVLDQANRASAVIAAPQQVKDPVALGAELRHVDAGREPSPSLENTQASQEPLAPSMNGQAAATQPMGTALSRHRPEPEAGMNGAAPLVQVQCFGEFMVRSGGCEIMPKGKGGTSYMAWEVLAFLATYPDDAVPKEKLYAALWPDVDAESASSRLRHALHRLRSLLRQQVPGLTPDVVRTERDDTRRLDPNAVRSDAQQFLALCRAARKLPPAEARCALQQALDLYQGDLLARGPASAYAWVDERIETGVSLREYYRTEYNQATRQLARLYYEAGQAVHAIPLYKRLLKAEPTLEDVVRDLFRCYQQLGDLGALIREERQLRDALRKAYHDTNDPNDSIEHYQPERDTVTLFKSIRQELEGIGTDGRVGEIGT